jgi:hypothetical protein
MRKKLMDDLKNNNRLFLAEPVIRGDFGSSFYGNICRIGYGGDCGRACHRYSRLFCHSVSGAKSQNRKTKQIKDQDELRKALNKNNRRERI